MLHLWEEECIQQTSDIKIKVNDQVYKLHKLVLNISPVLKNLTVGGYIESYSDTIELFDMENSIWEFILDHLYDLMDIARAYNLLNGSYRSYNLLYNNIHLTLEKIENLNMLVDLYEKSDYFQLSKLHKIIQTYFFTILEYLIDSSDPSMSQFFDLIYSVLSHHNPTATNTFFCNLMTSKTKRQLIISYSSYLSDSCFTKDTSLWKYLIHNNFLITVESSNYYQLYCQVFALTPLYNTVVSDSDSDSDRDFNF